MASEILLGNKNYATVGINNSDRYAANGYAWRMSTGVVTLAAATNYVTINFTTPATGSTVYSFSDVDKTGDELTITLVEGGTYAGGSAISLFNFNRIVGDANPPFVAKSGLSTGGATITGGVSSPIRFVQGTATGGASVAGTSSSYVAFYILKPSTSYTLKITALGTNTKLAASLGIAYIPVQM